MDWWGGSLSAQSHLKSSSKERPTSGFARGSARNLAKQHPAPNHLHMPNQEVMPPSPQVTTHFSHLLHASTQGAQKRQVDAPIAHAFDAATWRPSVSLVATRLSLWSLLKAVSGSSGKSSGKAVSDSVLPRSAANSVSDSSIGKKKRKEGWLLAFSGSSKGCWSRSGRSVQAFTLYTRQKNKHIRYLDMSR